MTLVRLRSPQGLAPSTCKLHFTLTFLAGEPVNGIENRLDRCTVTVSPALNPDHEQIEVPEELLKSLSIVGSISADGADFSGAEMIYNYERLLRQVSQACYRSGATITVLGVYSQSPLLSDLGLIPNKRPGKKLL